MELNLRSFILLLVRLSFYILIIIGLFLILRFDATHPTSTGKFGEISGTEILQEIFLLLLSAGFLFVGLKEKTLAPFTGLLSIFFMMSFIREFNNFIDHWFYFVLPLMVLFILLVIFLFRRLLAAFQQFFTYRSSGYFFSGFLVTYVFSRFFGRTDFWKLVLEDKYVRTARTLAEEGVELLGYTLFVIALIELAIDISAKKEIKQ